MKNQEIRELSNEKLAERLSSEKLILSKLKFSHAISPIENPMRIRQTRKLVAQLATELNKRK
ncbi:MAG: 50S ribosomal protein L29 [Cytophagales bacterium]